jgi:hypothetical protein
MLIGAPVSGAFIYWANSNQYRVGRAKLDGSDARSQFAAGMYPCGVASDGTYVYWADPIANAIGRARIDGTGSLDRSFVSGAEHPCGVAIYGHYVYWANEQPYQVSTSIGRADLRNRLDVRENFVPNERFTKGTDLDYPCGVAVDATGIYWGDRDSNAIGHANLDGTGERTLITGASQPCGVALADGYIYWANEGKDTIGVARIIGGPADESFITGASSPCGVAVYSHYIYWINQAVGRGTLSRADLTSPNPSASAQDIVTGLNYPCGVAVDGLFQGTLRIGAPRARRDGSVAIPVVVSGTGSLSATQVSGRAALLRPAHARAVRAGQLTLILAPTAHRRSLSRRHPPTRIRVRVTFEPTGGLADTRTTTITLKSS